jgi:hypothetical protein
MFDDQQLLTTVDASLDRKTLLVDEDLLLHAQSFVAGCERCATSSVASLTFEYILDALTDCDSTVTDYLLCRPAECPVCLEPIREGTPVLAL